MWSQSPSSTASPWTGRGAFLGFAPEFAVSSGFSLLGDLYWRSADVPGEAARLAADVGFQVEVAQRIQVQGSVGTSLRRDGVGGPQIRCYLGLHGVFTIF